MKAYKLTDKNSLTMNETKWGEGVSHETSGEGELCGLGWLHYYEDPLLAVFISPLHVSFDKPQLWEAKVEGAIKHDRGLKSGCTKLTTVKRIEFPKISTTQRVAFGILCAKKVCTDIVWTAWADRWLSGEDRSLEAAKAAWAATAAVAAAAKAAWAATAAVATAWAVAEVEAEVEATTAWAAATAVAAAATAVAATTAIDLKSIAAEAIKY